VAQAGERRRFEQGSAAMGRWFEVEAVRIGGEGSRLVALLFSDVTDRKQQEDRLRLGIDVAGFALLEIDYEADVIHLTAEAARLYGLGDEAITLPREQVHAAFHPDDRDALVGRIALTTSRDAAEPYTTEYRVLWPSGEVRWLSVRKKVIFAGDEASRKPARAILAALDITARKRAEQDRQALLDALAHDLRNPLTTLKMQAQLLQRQLRRGQTTDRETLAGRIAGFVELAERMTGLIDDLEEYAQLGLGGGAPHRQPTDLVALARTSVAEIARTGSAHSIQFETESDELVGLWDPLHVSRVLDNLLSNAMKYSPAGSAVQVALSRVGRYAVVEVRDAGIGIPEEDLPHIFAFRHRGGNVGPVAGSGVGLAGVKQIVEQLGGSVAVRSNEGRGSVFSVRLPLMLTRHAPPAT
jgi:PAS domain S-box-containing protein